MSRELTRVNAPSPSDRVELLQRAIACCQRGDLDAADAFCALLLATGPDAAAAHVRGIVRMQRGDLEGAKASLQEALAHGPVTPELLACAGSIAIQLGQLDAALGYYRQALAADAEHADALAGLGAVQHRRGEFAAARDTFAACTTLHPESVAGWCNLGGACAALADLAAAAAAYRRALAIDPTAVVAHQGLIWVLSTAGDETDRRAAVVAWAAACPADPVARHLSSALAPAAAPDRCSDAFVASYFDQFAPDYDRVLAHLGTRIAETFATMWNEAEVAADSVLDVGCGTGSGSGWLRAPGRRLVGIDLSRGMLARAERTGLYAELHIADAMKFLAIGSERFDAVVLADVLPYFGDVAPLLTAIAGRLTDGGHLLLSFEQATERGHQLAPTGRFVHHPDDVHAAAQRSGFGVIAARHGVLRQEGGLPVVGGCTLVRLGVRGRTRHG